jgi:hypothetical protein
MAKAKQGLSKEDLEKMAEEVAANRERHDTELRRLNQDYCVVREGGKTRVLYFENVFGRRVPTFQSFEDFRNFLLNETMTVGKEEVSLGHWWLRHPERRQYDGITFEPNKGDVVGNKLNLWQGWAIEPKKGNWDLMKRHMKEVLCDNDSLGYEYLMNWLAWSLQNPDKPAEVAVVFKGIRGSGKGTLGNALCKIFGQHAFHVSAASQFAGRFNAHLRPAGEMERRFQVFNTNNEHAQKKAWLDPLYEELENGGYAAMLYDLLRRDISNFHPRQIYRTKALAKQQRLSLSYEDMAWSEILETGMLGGVYNDKVPNEVVSNDWEDYKGKYKGLYTHMREMSPSLRYKSDRHLADYLVERGGRDENDKPLVKRKKVGGHRGWEFPSLEMCRAHWLKKHPEWESDTDITEWGGEWNGATDGNGSATANDNIQTTESGNGGWRNRYTLTPPPIPKGGYK